MFMNSVGTRSALGGPNGAPEPTPDRPHAARVPRRARGENRTRKVVGPAGREQPAPGPLLHGGRTLARCLPHLLRDPSRLRREPQVVAGARVLYERRLLSEPFLAVPADGRRALLAHARVL